MNNLIKTAELKCIAESDIVGMLDYYESKFGIEELAILLNQYVSDTIGLKGYVRT